MQQTYCWAFGRQQFIICTSNDNKCAELLSAEPPPCPPPLTTFGGFIRAVGAVDVVVAHKVLGDALPVLAHELGLRVAGAVGVHCGRRKQQTGVAQPRAWCLCDFQVSNSRSSHLLQPALTLSSAPSGQSLSPSHFQRCGTHMCEPGHWKASGLQVLDSEATLRGKVTPRQQSIGENIEMKEKSVRNLRARAEWLVAYCTSGPRRSRRRSRRRRRTPSGRRCSGGWRTQTGWRCRICLQRAAQRGDSEGEWSQAV